MNDAPLVATLGLPAALAVIMCALGLSLTPGDFKRVLVFPKGVAIGLANLLVLSPLLGFAIAEAFGLAPELAVGLVLMASAPGGTMANLLTHLARGDTALSVTMTGISSIAAVVTVPLYLGLSIDFFDARVADDVGMLGVVARVFAITIVPLAIGMALRARDPVRAQRLEPRVKRVALGVFVIVVAGAIVSELDVIGEHFAELALATLTLNIAAMSVSYAIARAGPAPRRPVDGHRARARRPPLHPGHRGDHQHRDHPRHAGGRLLPVHVLHRGALRAIDVPAQRAEGGGRSCRGNVNCRWVGR